MPSREELHALVETLPEESIEMALRNLKHLQTPPRKLPPELEEMRKQAREGGRGLIGTSGSTGSLHFKLDPSGLRKRGSFHSSGYDGEAHVSLERFLFDSHEFIVKHRIEPHGNEKTLIFHSQIEGPDDQKYQYEATLNLPS